MSTHELLAEIQKLPVDEQRRLLETLAQSVGGQSAPRPSMSEDEFAQHLLSQGIITHLPTGITDGDDDFEPIEVEGEPLSETIIRERR